MFTWITKKCVESNEGFRVQSLGRHKMQYVDATGLTITLDRDLGLDSDMTPCVLISKNAFDRWDNGEQLDEEDKTKVNGNFKAAIRFQGMTVSTEL